MNDVILVADLDALSDADFVALFAGGPAVKALILHLGQHALEKESA
jgi:hypothetical protein